ncbi:MAG: hypothetical protein ABEL04_14520 [Salinibacter sp.]|uniref:hypothetical protein n=1 Tax=Salinibacter sp. TaxID=2065818 RepID=UPI0035D48B03
MPPTRFSLRSPRSGVHDLSVYLIALLFGAAGTAHFVWPAAFARIVPPFLPAPYTLVYVSGIAELLGAIGVLVPGLRTVAGWGLLLLLLAVFPANVHMALHPTDFARIPAWALYLRLPLQFILIGWIYWALALRIGG